MNECNPQLENGHTRIANELLDAVIRYPFNGTEQAIVLLIMRRTYGWSKKKAFISYKEIKDATGKDIRNIKKYVKKLIEEKVIVKEACKGKNVFSLNKRYSGWRLWINT